jgi:hypothetical protein
MNIPTKSPFSDLLKQCRMDKTELAQRLGLNRGSVYQWQEEAPKYAIAYLGLYRKHLALQERSASLEKVLTDLQQRARSV